MKLKKSTVVRSACDAVATWPQPASRAPYWRAVRARPRGCAHSNGLGCQAADKPAFVPCVGCRHRAWEAAQNAARITQPLDAVDGKRLPPLTDRNRGDLQRGGYLLVVRPVRRSQDNAAAQSQRLR